MASFPVASAQPFRRASTLTFAIKAETGSHRAAWNLCFHSASGYGYQADGHFFSCSNSRVLRARDRERLLAIKMPGSVGENRYNEEVRPMKNGNEPISQRRRHNEAPERHRNRGSSVPS